MLGGFIMKPSQALGRALLLIFITSQTVKCGHAVQVALEFGSLISDTSEEHISKDGLFNMPHSSESAPLQYRSGFTELEGDSRIIRDVSDLTVNQNSKETSAKGTGSDAELHTSVRGDRQHSSAAEAHENGENRKPTERVKVEIIERPKELKVFVNKSPTITKQSVTDEGKKGWKQLQRAMMKKEGRTPPEKTTSSEDWEARFATESEKYSDDDDDDFDISGSGDDTSKDYPSFHDVLHGESFLSRDHATHAKVRHAHRRKRPESSSGGLGILWSLVLVAFVLSVVAVIFLRRWCCRGKMPQDVELESVKVDHTMQPANQTAIKEARIKVGKRKSLENRKVLRKLSTDQGASTVKEELAIACSVIAPSMETRTKNSEALHTRACVRAATSHSRRNSSFQEDLVKARCEFENAPARFAKLVSLAGDEKDTEAKQDSEEPAKTAGDSAVVVELQ